MQYLPLQISSKRKVQNSLTHTGISSHRGASITHCLRLDDTCEGVVLVLPYSCIAAAAQGAVTGFNRPLLLATWESEMSLFTALLSGPDAENKPTDPACVHMKDCKVGEVLYFQGRRPEIPVMCQRKISMVHSIQLNK